MPTTELEISPNGHEEVEEETQEQLETVYRNLKDLTRPDGSVVTMGKQELSLLKQILVASTEEFKEQIMWRMCDFIDEDEARDHVDAFYEAKDLGMDTGFNVAYMFALCSANRKVTHSNLIAQLLDAVQHGKWAPPQTAKGKNHEYVNPRSPISG